jgi:hypothetical protein
MKLYLRYVLIVLSSVVPFLIMLTQVFYSAIISLWFTTIHFSTSSIYVGPQIETTIQF